MTYDDDYDYEHKNKTDQLFYGSGGCGLVFVCLILAVLLCVTVLLLPKVAEILGILFFAAFFLALPVLDLHEWFSGLMKRRRANRRFFPEEDKTALREILRIEQSWLASDVEKWLREERNLDFSTYEAMYWWKKIRQENLPEKTPASPSHSSDSSGVSEDFVLHVGMAGIIGVIGIGFLLLRFNIVLPLWLDFLLIAPVGMAVMYGFFTFLCGILWLGEKIENWVE